MATELAGKWKLDHSTKTFDDYLVKLGVGFVKRNLAKATTNVVQTITIDGDKITISMTSPVSSKETTFIVGQAVEEKTLHGEKVQTTIRWEGDKLIAESTECKQPLINTRHIEDGMMVNTLTVADVSCQRFYKRAN